MLYGLYLAASGAMMQDAKQAVTANNLANVNTCGFKKDLMTLLSRPTEAVEDNLLFDRDSLFDKLGGGALIQKTSTDFSDGSIEITGNPLDLAISGDGFFKVSDGENDYLTRAGNFTLNNLHELVTFNQKYKVVTPEGTPIVINGTDIQIGQDGTLEVDGVAVGQIPLVTVEDLSRIRKHGNNLFTYDKSEKLQPGSGTIHQNSLEKSTVTAVEEMTRMITGMRSYETNMRLIRYLDTTMDQAANTLGRIPV